MCAVIDVCTFGFHTQLGGFRHVIGVRDSGELFDLAFAGQFIQAFAVAAFAFLDRGCNVHFDKGTELLNALTDLTAGGGIGRDRRADGDATVLGDLGRDIADALDVEIAVLFREAQLGGQVLTHNIAVQKGHGAATHFHQLDHQRVGDGGFARAGEAGEEHGEALI